MTVYKLEVYRKHEDPVAMISSHRTSRTYIRSIYFKSESKAEAEKDIMVKAAIDLYGYDHKLSIDITPVEVVD